MTRKDLSVAAFDEKAYLAQLSWYRQMTDWLPVLVSYVDRELRYQYNNRAYCEWFELSDQHVLKGRTLKEVLGEAALAVILPYAQSALVGERVVFEAEIPYRDGGKRTVEAIYAPHVESGETVGFFAMVTDISQRKQLETTLVRAEKLEALGHLAGGIAHDFNNFMTGIMGNLELAEMEIADGDLPAAMKRLARCRAGSKMAQELTVQLLAFSKGGAPVRILGAPAKAIQEAAELAVAGSSVRLECQFASDLWAVEHDAGQLGQVISNLVINAAQAMPDGGVVSLVAANVAGDGEGDENAWVRVEVKDSGIGIAQEIAKQIFDPYYTTKEGGRGLGLTTAYKIVSAHGGNLEFESVPGEGATFHFSLPARPRATLSEPAKELTPRLKPRRLLVMDDDGAVRTVARAFLERAGHDVVTVNEGQQAVKVYQEAMSHGQPFDLVILDLTVVEGQGGRETVRQLKLSDPRVRAIVSSGYSHDPVMSDYAAHGFIDVLPKPYSSVQLEAAVARVLWNGPT